MVVGVLVGASSGVCVCVPEGGREMEGGREGGRGIPHPGSEHRRVCLWVCLWACLWVCACVCVFMGVDLRKTGKKEIIEKVGSHK